MAKNRIGEEMTATNGQKMKIIDYRSAIDIDVQFEDGTVVKNKQYASFKKGSILNPNFAQHKDDRLGETAINKYGQRMTIIAYRDSRDIDVKFDDNSIARNQRYGHFKDGTLMSPILFREKKAEQQQYMNRVGEESIASNGQKMKIIAYRSATDLDVQFEDGVIAKNKQYRAFKDGLIANPNFKIALHTSINEFAIQYYLQKYGFEKAPPGTLSHLKGFGGMEIDIYSQKHKIAIEYDGYLHVKNPRQDKLKNQACKENGITLIRVREKSAGQLEQDGIHQYMLSSGARLTPELERTIKQMINDVINPITGSQIDTGNINIARDKFDIVQKYNAIFRAGIINAQMMNKDGERMTLVAYRNVKDVDIRLDDGTLLQHQDFHSFKDGNIDIQGQLEMKEEIGQYIDADDEQEITINDNDEPSL